VAFRTARSILKWHFFIDPPIGAMIPPDRAVTINGTVQAVE